MAVYHAMIAIPANNADHNLIMIQLLNCASNTVETGKNSFWSVMMVTILTEMDAQWIAIFNQDMYVEVDPQTTMILALSSNLTKLHSHKQVKSAIKQKS